MENYNYTIIEKWWRSLGGFDRYAVSGINNVNMDTGGYLSATDNWWDSLTNEEKVEKYNDFFEE